MQGNSIKYILEGSILYYRLLSEGLDGTTIHPHKVWRGRAKQFIPIYPRPDLSVVIVEVLEEDPAYKDVEDYVLVKQILWIEEEEQPGNG